MTGFRLSWRIESTTVLELTTNEIGQTVQTPGLGGNILDEEFYQTSWTYNCTLLFPENITEMVGSGSLVIEVAVDTREHDECKVYLKAL